MRASLELAGAQHSLSPMDADGGGDAISMRRRDLKRELIRAPRRSPPAACGAQQKAEAVTKRRPRALACAVENSRRWGRPHAGRFNRAGFSFFCIKHDLFTWPFSSMLLWRGYWPQISGYHPLANHEFELFEFDRLLVRGTSTNALGRR
jgi:hypothetical protein